MAPKLRSSTVANIHTPNRDPSQSSPGSSSPNRNEFSQQENDIVEESQRSPKSKMQQLMEDMEGAQRKRRAANKQRVSKAYITVQTSTRVSITTLFDTHQKNADEVYEAHISRLKSLFEQKVEIEQTMKERLEAVRRDYLVQVDALKKVVEFRCKELR
ncbi:unnamed protein product [Periconia digitata]|uniref:Uncharacterized protein n=1 Tax=Periconia digitata TaxID=1303443 RepID=A0A9W4XS78_9PLEO|nr:unnamed protein product [Periconia digitata]